MSLLVSRQGISNRPTNAFPHFNQIVQHMFATRVKGVTELLPSHPLEPVLEDVACATGATLRVANAGVQCRAFLMRIVRRAVQDIRIVEDRFASFSCETRLALFGLLLS